MRIYKNIQYFNVTYAWQEKSWNDAKKNAESFRDNEKNVFGPIFEEVIAKWLTSKNK